MSRVRTLITRLCVCRPRSIVLVFLLDLAWVSVTKWEISPWVSSICPAKWLISCLCAKFSSDSFGVGFVLSRPVHISNKQAFFFHEFIFCAPYFLSIWWFATSHLPASSPLVDDTCLPERVMAHTCFLRDTCSLRMRPGSSEWELSLKPF